MEKQVLNPEEGPEAAGKLPSAIQPQFTSEDAGWDAFERNERAPFVGMEERGETQWQQFLKTLQLVHPGEGKSKMSEASPWEDPEAFLASFEQVAQACQWRRAEWVACLLPALSGEAKEAFQKLEMGERENYGKRKVLKRRSKESGETAMKVPHFSGAETEEGAGKPASLVQPLYMTELPTCGASQKIKMEPLMGTEQRWEAQWQEFLRTLHPRRGGNPMMMSEASPWEDPKAFLASFEQVATVCQWPRGEWTARLRPALSRGVEEAFQTLEDRDQEDYGKALESSLQMKLIRLFPQENKAGS
ncbi:hypothetical protein E2320_014419 [Naja naja]|nr:hypothetical protein E2320_014419 [Naja naja]